MQELEVKSVQQILCDLPGSLCGHWFYRGVRSSEHQLIPAIGRQKTFKDIASAEERDQREESMLEDFKNRSKFITQCDPKNDWEWLALAQHHRMPTRLLDWSSSLLVALYFACEKDINADGSLADYKYEKCAIYMSHSISLVPYEEVCDSPLACDVIGMVSTPHVTTRMSSQSGVFSVQANPLVSFDTEYEDQSEEEFRKNKRTIIKIIIPADVREKLHQLLLRFGVRSANIFPDLDGLATEIRIKHDSGCTLRSRKLSI